jgi:hypothetical protein
MDKLKQHLRAHREQLDIDEPGEATWLNIRAAAPVVKKLSPVALLYRYAAVLLVVTGLAIGIRVLFQYKQPIKNADAFAFVTPVLSNNKKQPHPSFPSTAPGTQTDPAKKTLARNKKTARIDPYELLGSFSNNYAQLVKLQLKSIRATPVWGEEPSYFSDFKSSLEQMDADEAALRIIIQKNGLDEHLLEQVINIYQQKLDLLKTLKSEIGKVNGSPKPANADSLKSYFINI